MTDEVQPWQAARLFPVSGMNGADEQERRGTSALLAVLASVREFGRAITTQLGAPAGAIETFIEVPFMLDGQRVIPDGLIRVTRGQRTWVALVEVKTGKAELQTQQLENYLDVAREQGYDALLTISNQLATSATEHPTPVDKRKLRKVAMHHMAWSQIHTEAIMQRLAQSVSDADQAWILSEFIRYLDHPKSGGADFDDMGAMWVTVRDAVATQTLGINDDGARDVAAKWEQLVRFAGMSLGRQLAVGVPPAVSRKEAREPGARVQAQTKSLAETGRLTGALKVPNTAGQLSMVADLRTGKIECSTEVAAPQEGRPQTRVTWLLRQLKEAPDDARIDTYTAWGRGATCSELLGNVRENPGILVDAQKRDIRAFQIAVLRPAGTKRGQGRGSFVASVVDNVEAFYVDVVQNLKPWTAPAPKVRDSEAQVALEAATGPAMPSTAPSSEDSVVPPASIEPPDDGDAAGDAQG